MKMNKLTMIMAVAALSVSTLASAQTVQPAQETNANSMPAASNQGPKTREQVRAELARARMDGTIPRFGYPDPY
jgi:hypothetical protein